MKISSAMAAAVLAGWTSLAAADTNDSKKTIGLALTLREPALYETADGKEECPAGLHMTNRENFLEQHPTEEARQQFYRERVYLNPRSPGDGTPELFLLNRGPGGEHVGYQPTLVDDQPLRLVQSKKAFGFNLDGTSDGRATPKSCKHDKFAAVDGGEAAIDNQLYRIYGCSNGWRTKGYQRERIGLQISVESMNRVLIEIGDVDDERNDEHVTVRIFKGIDPIPLNAAGKPIPWVSHRIDVRFPQYRVETTGRITDGVLTTEPVDMRMAMRNSTIATERYLRAARLQLTLSETTAEGMLGGYESLREWWQGYVASFSRITDSLGRWSPPAFHAAAVQLADGYPDPDTGLCTAISFADRIEAVRAFIVEPRTDDPLRGDPKLQAAMATVSVEREKVAKQ